MAKKKSSKAKKIFLVDGHALSYRSFYAIKELSNSKGQATNAVFGFVNALRKLIKEHQPEYLAVCFDSKEKTLRQQKFADYKIQRPPMPESLISQMTIIKDVMNAFNIATFECPGYEADDIIATITKRMNKNAVEVVIATEDKDMYQLIDNHVSFFSFRKDAVLGYKELNEKLGFDPGIIVDYLALAGDKADNIPGVAGVGEVTARKLLNEFGSLDKILKNAEKLTPEKLRDKIVEQRQMAELSRELAELETQVPIEYSLEDMKIQEPDDGRLHELFMELEFKRLALEFSGVNKQEEDVSSIKLVNKKDIKVAVSEIKKSKIFSFYTDIESETDCETVYLGINKRIYTVSPKDIGDFDDVFNDDQIIKVTFDLKENLKKLTLKNIHAHSNVFDVMLAGYLLEPSRSRYRITDLAWNYAQSTIFEESSDAQKADVLLKLYEPMSKELKKRSLTNLMKDIEVPLAYVLYLIEEHGVNIDVNLLQELSGECSKEINRLTKKIYKLAGEEFNINSPKQLGVILFEKLDLPVIKKTKTGFSTNEEVLNVLAESHELPELILSYRQYTKLKSTYLDALPKLVDQKTGRIHAQFNQVQTETGRLSSNNPNLQNIPIRTELGRQIRGAVIPSKKENIMLSADYSQIELRVLAHLSKDKNLMNAFKKEQDIHQYTASLMFDVKEGDVTTEMRYAAKRVNFGIIYGMSAFGLAKDLKITQPEAQEFINRYFARYPDVKKFMNNEVAKCEKQGYVTTLLKRRRYIPEITSQNNAVKQFAQRQAINTPVQGSAADLIKLAMINIQNELEQNSFKSQMLITVHDELVFDVIKGEKKKLVDMIRDRMENSLTLTVPIKVTIKEGPNWLNMKEV